MYPQTSKSWSLLLRDDTPNHGLTFLSPAESAADWEIMSETRMKTLLSSSSAYTTYTREMLCHWLTIMSCLTFLFFIPMACPAVLLTTNSRTGHWVFHKWITGFHGLSAARSVRNFQVKQQKYKRRTLHGKTHWTTVLTHFNSTINHLSSIEVW